MGLARALAALALLACASCGDDPGPRPDTIGPVIDVTLSVRRTGDWCPAMASFRLNPMGSSDDVTDRDDLQARWDVEGDGTWDSGFLPLAVLDGIAFSTLPSGAWNVRGEVRDLAGNVTVYEGALDLPDWVPRDPDIIAGAVWLRLPVGNWAPIDTVESGRDFTISALRRDWVSTPDRPFRTRFYVDDTLVAEHGSVTSYPDPYGCPNPTTVVFGGIDAPGLHEIRIVYDADNEIAETDEGNNVAVRTVFVLAPARPGRSR